MGKELVTKRDFELAFKALDEIDYPEVTGGPVANRANLKEAFNRKSGFDIINEEYYSINDANELKEAQEDREAEVAKAKLARIEKIVDLDAESEEDIAPTYVGKVIIQCPQCMTLFYKNPEDIEKSEEDPEKVNIGEKCQHCGNEEGYMLIGKVAAEKPEELPEETSEKPVEDPALADAELPVGDEVPTEEDKGQSTEETQPAEETSTEDDLSELDLPAEETEEEPKEEEKSEEEEEKKEESLESTDKESLNEDTKKLSNGKYANVGDDGKVDSGTFKTKKEADAQRKAMYANGYSEDLDSDLDKLLNTPEFKTPISDKEVKSYFEGLDEAEEEIEIEDLDEKALDKHICEYLTRTYPKIKNYYTEDCCMDDDKLIVKGIIVYTTKKGDKERPTEFSFCPDCTDEKGNIKFIGCNKDICDQDAFNLDGHVKDKCLVIESLSYKYKIHEKLIEGKTN